MDCLVAFAQAYNSKPGDTHWNPNADIDGKGVVGLSNLVILASHYGQQYTIQEQVRDAVMAYVKTIGGTALQTTLTILLGLSARLGLDYY